MEKFLKIFAYLVVYIFSLSVFGWMAIHIEKGDKNFGYLNKTIQYVATFPDLFNQSVEEVKKLPGTFVKTPSYFEPINKLDKNLIVLYSYSDTADSRSIVLHNLKNDSILYKWVLKNPYEDYDRIFNPILLENKELVYSYNGLRLRKIDSLSNIIWKQDSLFGHHAMNIDSEGKIWVCTYEPFWFANGLYHLDEKSVFIKDNYISKINPENGKIEFHKSLIEILRENNLANYILKTSNMWDPIHLNDIEPVLKTTPYFQEGDLFISLRQPSIVLYYRPSTNKVLKVIEGKFVSQHDVDIFNDSSIVVFNNNYYSIDYDNGGDAPKDSSFIEYAGEFYSNIVKYNFHNDSFEVIGEDVFAQNEIHSKTEGLVHFFNDSTYFVEEQNTGVLWVLEGDKVLYKNVLKSQHEGYHHLTNWTRIIQYDDK